MTSTQIVSGAAPSRPNRWPLTGGGSVLIEASPAAVVIQNQGAGAASVVKVDPDDAPLGGVSDLAAGGSVTVPAGERRRVSALSGLVLWFTWQ